MAWFSRIFCLILLPTTHKLFLSLLPHFIFLSSPVLFRFYLFTFCFNNLEMSPSPVSISICSPSSTSACFDFHSFLHIFLHNILSLLLSPLQCYWVFNGDLFAAYRVAYISISCGCYCSWHCSLGPNMHICPIVFKRDYSQQSSPNLCSPITTN